HRRAAANGASDHAAVTRSCRGRSDSISINGAFHGATHKLVAPDRAAASGTFAGVEEQFEAMRKNLGFVPNSILIRQRKPKLAKALAQMTAAVWDPESKVDRGFKRIIAHVASRAAGCQYCMAHTAGGALHFGVADTKLAAVWDYPTSPLYSTAERVTLDFALAAGSVPNTVTDEMFAELRQHWSEEQIVEIVGVIPLV